MLAEGLDGALGSTVGPDGALYVVEGVAGRIARIDPRTGHTSVFASGLPKRVVAGLGGATDVAFLGRQAYALVTLVSPDVGGTSADGIYRIDGPTSSTLVADIGTWSIDHPPKTAFEVPSGMAESALQAYRGHFLVDGRAPQPRPRGHPPRCRLRAAGPSATSCPPGWRSRTAPSILPRRAQCHTCRRTA